MICRKGSGKIIDKPAMLGGQGTAKLCEIFQKGDYRGQARLMGVLTLEPDCSVGNHVHMHDEELIFVLSGCCEYNDNGNITVLETGDAALTRSGERHEIKNTSNEQMTYLAVVMTYSRGDDA